MYRRRLAIAAAAVVAVLSLYNLFAAQKDRAQVPDVFWVNLPSSPLRIAVSGNGRHLEARNHSFGTVAGYQLGCVIEESGRITVEARFETAKTDLGPVDPDGKVWFTEIDLKYRDICREKNAKLAVVRVTFADGSEWTIRP